MVSKSPMSRSLKVASTPSAIVRVCKQILAKLKAHSFPNEDIFSVHLAMEEAFINAVEHGNKMDANKEVRIDYSIDGDKVEIAMTDEGEGFKPNNVPDPRYGENLYKTDGRGLFLIKAYMNEVEFNERGNCVRMVKYKGKPSTSESELQSQTGV
jgi:serine/threonine-protein kinase RsbW